MNRILDDELVQELRNIIGEWERKRENLNVRPSAKDSFIRNAAERLSALSPRVKALDWDDCVASTPFGSYTVADDVDDLWHFTFHCYPYGAESEEGWGREEHAKAAAQADYERRIMSAIEVSASPRVVTDTPTHRHKKRGTEYVLIGIGKMQAEMWMDGLDESGESSVDMREVAVYRSATNPAEIWVRPREEFEDGRFEVLPSAGEKE